MGKSRKSMGGGGTESPEPQETEEVQKFTDEQWANVSTPEEIAELIGWEVEVTRNKSGKVTSMKFHDPETNMDVEFNNLTGNNAKHFFDMENKGRSAPNDKLTQKWAKYGLEFDRKNIRDVIRTIQELPMDNKKATPALIFDNKITPDSRYIVYGTHQYAHYEGFGHSVRIYGSSFFKNKKTGIGSGHSLERTIRHETNHAVDYMSSPNPNSDDYHGSGISSNPKFLKIINKIGGLEKGNAITNNVSGYTTHDPKFRKECWADAKSIVQTKDAGGGDEYVQLGNGNVITVNQWCEKYSELVDVVRELDSSSTGYNKPSSFNKPLMI